MKVKKIKHELINKGSLSGIPVVKIELCKEATELDVEKLFEDVAKIDCKNILWIPNGEESAIDFEVIKAFKNYFNIIITDGRKQVNDHINYIIIDKHTPTRRLRKKFADGISELWVNLENEDIEEMKKYPESGNYFVYGSGLESNQRAIELALQNNIWRLLT